ncbi:MAG: NAD+ synthase [Planctomycetota bacterium]
MRIGLGQFNPIVGDFKGNAAKIERMYKQAVSADLDLLLFPELSLCGYPPEDLLLKRHFLQDNYITLENIANNCSKATMIVGFAESWQGETYNSAAVIHDGRITEIYRKASLPNWGVFDEKRYFQPGKQPLIINIDNLNIAITICFDIWGLQWLSEFLKDIGNIDILVNISASPYHMGKTSQREQVLTESAKTFHSAVAYCNLVGGQDELLFDGRSILMDSTGQIIAKAAAFKEDLLIADIFKKDENLVEIVPATPPAPQPIDLVDEVYQALVLGTTDYVKKNNFKKVLLGLSGGIDSSVTASITTTALGAENVVGITMPSEFNSPETRADAEELAKNLNIEFWIIPIGRILDEFDRELKNVSGWNKKSIAYENLQARIRGNLLMSLSNSMGAIVLTSGNKSETAVGYATLYGDTAGGFAIIKDVPKTLVYKLADHINKISGRKVIPQSVIDRPPSAELSPDQKDTDSLPDYDLLDTILKGYVEEDKSIKELVEMSLPADLVKLVTRMVDQNEYKRRQSPPGIKITPKAFGKDRRLPITNRYK